MGRTWSEGGWTKRLAWWHRLFAIYCLHRPDSRFILMVNHPIKDGYTMKMHLSHLDGWASQLVSTQALVSVILDRVLTSHSVSDGHYRSIYVWWG